MRRLAAALLAFVLTSAPVLAQNGLPGGPGAQIPNSAGTGGGSPTGAAGGDLGGTYPNPTVAGVGGVAFGTGVTAALQSTAGGTGGFALQSSLANYCLLTGCTYSGVILVPAGSATTPGVGAGIAATGLYSVSTTGLGLTVNGTVRADWGITNANTWTFNTAIRATAGVFSTGNVQVSSGVFNFSAGGIISGPTGTGLIQLGAGDAAAPVAQVLSMQSVVAGTSNTAGANATIQGSLSTGSGVSGDLVFKSGGTGAAATVQNAAVAAITIKGGSQSVAVGNAALTTTNTGGFLYVAAAAGTPTGAPIAISGYVPMYLDTTNNQLWLYFGGTWKQPKTPAGAALVTWQ